MKKIIAFFLFFLFFFQVYAQEPTAPSPSENMHWFCLTPGKTDIENHRTELFVKEGLGYRDNEDTYIVVRVAYDHSLDGALNLNADNSGMSTGNQILDREILGGDEGYVNLKKKLGFGNAHVVNGSNPTKTFPVIWTDDLLLTMEKEGYVDRAHYWYGVQKALPVSEVTAGGSGGFQQGTFTFSSAGGAKDCSVVRWDPFGYVFDAETHGPVSGVYVRILSSTTENGIFTPVPVGIGKGKVPQNPIATQSDGSYRYYVDPGYYKLELLGDVSQSGRQYIIETDREKIRPGYEEFGYEQLYMAEKPDVIREIAGKVERRDIAIQTIGAPPPFSTGPKLKDILVNRSIKNGEHMVRITGMAGAIPLEFTALYSDREDIKINEQTVELVRGHGYVPPGLHDERNFDILFPAVSDEGIGILKELRISSKYSPQVLIFPISPMPSYLRGIAQTESNIPIREGEVEIVPIGSAMPSYTTTTDEQGYFEVGTEWIPPIPYKLRYRASTGMVITVSTNTYLKQNALFHKENGIDSYSIHDVPSSSTYTSKTRMHKTQKTTSGSTQSTTENLKQSGTGMVFDGNQGVTMIIVILFILILLGFGTFIIMKSKQTAP